jgi:hypothetical protein
MRTSVANGGYRPGPSSTFEALLALYDSQLARAPLHEVLAAEQKLGYSYLSCNLWRFDSKNRIDQ